jgi:hypothetical protein
MEPPTPVDSPLRLRDVMSSPFYLGLMTPELADFAGERPVALVFGSYT